MLIFCSSFAHSTSLSEWKGISSFDSELSLESVSLNPSHDQGIPPIFLFLPDFLDVNRYSNEKKTEGKDEKAHNASIVQPHVYVPASTRPGEDYKALIGASAGVGRTSLDNLACVGINAQYFPNFSSDTGGVHVAIGTQAGYGYRGNTSDVNNYWQTEISVTPQVLWYFPIIPNVQFISGLSFPITFGRESSQYDGQPSFRMDRNTTGVAATTGLSLELRKWNIQVQADVANYIQTKVSYPNSPGTETTSNTYGVWLNKGNGIHVIVNRRIRSF